MNPRLNDHRWLERTRITRAVLVVDVVDSMRLTEADETGVLGRWLDFIDASVAQTLPELGGRLVKSLGDGMLVDFNSAAAAVRCAFAMNDRLADAQATLPAASRIRIRAGVHRCDVVLDERDIFGVGVNVAARVAGEAGADEVLITAEAREDLTEDIDACLTDLGPRSLRHVSEPVRIFRATPLRSEASPPVGGLPRRNDQFAPCLAVLPLRPLRPDPDTAFLGDAIAEEITTALSASEVLSVISHLSSGRLSGRALTPAQVGGLLGTTSVLSGTFVAHGQDLRLHVELADCQTSAVLWSTTKTLKLGTLFTVGEAFLSDTVAAIERSIIRGEMRRADERPYQSLETHALMLLAQGRMHSYSQRDFDEAKVILDHVVERHPRAARPLAWLAKWHVLRVAQGWSPVHAADSTQADIIARRALDIDPGDSLALTMAGLVAGYLRHDLSAARDFYTAALTENPNASLAWLFSATLNAWSDQGEAAASAATRALSLSPLDPIKYFYESLAGTAYLANGDYQLARDSLRRSLQRNRHHGSTWRMLTIASWHLGYVDEAREAVRQLRLLEPELTASSFLKRYPGRDSRHAADYARTLREAGLPQ